MAKILSQDEIDTLLASAHQVERAAKSRGSGRRQDAKIYDFRRPDRVTKEQVRALQYLHDRFARNVARSLSAYLRSITAVTVLSVEQVTYSEFLSDLPDPTAFFGLSIEPPGLMGAIELNPNVAFAMIERMLGGGGAEAAVSRALTEIEQSVVEAAVDLVVTNLVEAWQPVAGIQFQIASRETHPQMLQIAAPMEQMVQVAFTMTVCEVSGTLNLCLPTSVVESVGSTLAVSGRRARREPTATERRLLHDHLASVKLPVSGLVEASLPIGEFLALQSGDIISTGLSANNPVSVEIGGVVKFMARLVRLGHRIGLRIDRRVSQPALAETA